MRTLLRFGKNSRLRFVSHLDLQRLFPARPHRSGLPIAFSQGFNPHPHHVVRFGAAVGWTSEYEVLDFKLSAPMGRGRIEEAMRGALPEDLPVLGVRTVDDRFPAAMALVRCADYRITPEGENGSAISPPRKRFVPPNMSWACAGRNPASARSTCGLWRSSLEVRDGSLLARLMLTEKDTLKPDVLLGGLAALAGVEAPRARVHRLRLLVKTRRGRLSR